MGNKKAIMIWRLMLYENIQKTVVFKTYGFSTMQEIAYVLNQKASTVSNFYHGLISPRENLRYVDIYQTKISL
jgi:hypothetical protein